MRLVKWGVLSFYLLQIPRVQASDYEVNCQLQTLDGSQAVAKSLIVNEATIDQEEKPLHSERLPVERFEFRFSIWPASYFGDIGVQAYVFEDKYWEDEVGEAYCIIHEKVSTSRICEIPLFGTDGQIAVFFCEMVKPISP